MSHQNDSHLLHPVDGAGAPRAPYEPPAIVSEEAFETLALTCGKAQGGQGCDPLGSGLPTKS